MWQPNFLIEGAGDGVEGPEHPHPEWRWGFCLPLESPGPTPVTDDAAIVVLLEISGPPCPEQHPCKYIYVFWVRNMVVARTK